MVKERGDVKRLSENLRKLRQKEKVWFQIDFKTDEGIASIDVLKNKDQYKIRNHHTSEERLYDDWDSFSTELGEILEGKEIFWVSPIIWLSNKCL